jgi:hypothetical protein
LRTGVAAFIPRLNVRFATRPFAAGVHDFAEFLHLTGEVAHLLAEFLQFRGKRPGLRGTVTSFRAGSAGRPAEFG